jgi:hypothetical protein
VFGSLRRLQKSMLGLRRSGSATSPAFESATHLVDYAKTWPRACKAAKNRPRHVKER